MSQFFYKYSSKHKGPVTLNENDFPKRHPTKATTLFNLTIYLLTKRPLQMLLQIYFASSDPFRFPFGFFHF